jgi:hypothetical protein
LHAAIRGLARLAKKQGVRLRQSYLRIGKWAAMMAGRYAHAKQFNRHRRQLRILRVRLGRLIRDIRRKIAGDEQLEEVFAWPLSRADQIRSQQQRQRGWKLYSFHAPEVECIGKGKASVPYEFGIKASIVTTNRRAPGGQFVLHAKALPGNRSVELAVQPMVLYRHVLALDVAGFVEALAEPSNEGRIGRSGIDEANHRHCRLLRAHSERPYRRRPKHRDELTPFQLIELHSVPASAALHDSELSGISQRTG